MWAWKEYVNLSVIYTQSKDFLCGGKPRYNATMVTAVNRYAMLHAPFFVKSMRHSEVRYVSVTQRVVQEGKDIQDHYAVGTLFVRFFLCR